MTQALPPSPPQIVIVQDATTHQPTILLGFVAVGNEQSKSTLETTANAQGLRAQRSSNDKNEEEVMIGFPPSSDSRRALSLYRDALGGKFGSLKIEVIVAPVSALADGHLDMNNEVKAEPPSSIVVPVR